MLWWLRVSRSAIPSTWAFPEEAPCISPRENRIRPAEPHLEELGVSTTTYKMYATGVPFLLGSLWLQSQCRQHQQIYSVCLRKRPKAKPSTYSFFPVCTIHLFLSFHKSMIFPSHLQTLYIWMCSSHLLVILDNMDKKNESLTGIYWQALKTAFDFHSH